MFTHITTAVEEFQQRPGNLDSDEVIEELIERDFSTNEILFVLRRLFPKLEKLRIRPAR